MSKQTRDSFKLSGREVPDDHERSPQAQEYLDRIRSRRDTMSDPRSDELRAAEKEVHTAYIGLRVALERLHHVLNPPGTMQGDVGPLDEYRGQ